MKIDDFAREKLARIEAADLTRRLVATTRGTHGTASRDSRARIAFCDNDYLGLSQHPAVIAAACSTVRQRDEPAMKFRPMASAPQSATSRASSLDVTPQILM